ncbi:MAG: class I SAM-dependent methyltransferase [Dehalococcoidia bacterium]
MDFGCGTGEWARAVRETGLVCLGADFLERLPPERPEQLLAIEPEPYRLPFPDSHFDLVFSVAVFEHVQDYDSALQEIRRVLKPGGVALHVFPARWRPIEPHVRVPLATWCRARWWLSLWARLGIRKPSQRGRHWRLVAAENERYLRESTTYLSRRALARHFSQAFPLTRFVEGAYLRAGGGRWGPGRSLIGRLPGAGAVFSEVRMRVVCSRREP